MKLDEIDITKKMILIIGGHHGDEPTGIHICQGLYPMKTPGELAIIPCLNPVGAKNKTRECRGIDINRSYGAVPKDRLVRKTVDIIKDLCRLSRLVIDVHSTFDFLLDNPVFISNPYAEEYDECFSIEKYQTDAPDGSLRRFCEQEKIPMITYEAIEFNPMKDEQIQLGIDEILKVLEYAGLN